jgi:hypothetical protein
VRPRARTSVSERARRWRWRNARFAQPLRRSRSAAGPMLAAAHQEDVSYARRAATRHSGAAGWQLRICARALHAHAQRAQPQPRAQHLARRLAAAAAAPGTSRSQARGPRARQASLGARRQLAAGSWRAQRASEGAPCDGHFWWSRHILGGGGLAAAPGRWPVASRGNKRFTAPLVCAALAGASSRRSRRRSVLELASPRAVNFQSPRLFDFQRPRRPASTQPQRRRCVGASYSRAPRLYAFRPARHTSETGVALKA